MSAKALTGEQEQAIIYAKGIVEASDEDRQQEGVAAMRVYVDLALAGLQGVRKSGVSRLIIELNDMKRKYEKAAKTL